MPYKLSRVQQDALNRIVDAAPRPTDEQRARLRPLLAGRLGCPCGCASRLPYLDDAACIRHKPIRPAQDWALLNQQTGDPFAEDAA